MGKRREPRIKTRLQVRIAGIDASGRPLLQVVTTRDISRQGALLEGVGGTFKPGEIISVSYKNNKARFRVSWMGDTGTDRAGQMGVQSIDPAKCIWDAATLPPSAPDTFAPQAKERRQHQRVQCKLGAELHIEGAVALVRGELANLSVGGCFMEMSVVPENKTQVKLIVWVNDSKLAIKGIVVSRRPGFGISIRFTEMTAGVREQLGRFVQSHFAFRGR